MSRDDDELLGKGKRSADRTFDDNLQRVEKLASLTKIFWALLVGTGTALVAAAIWVTTIKSSVAAHEKALDRYALDNIPNRLKTAELQIDAFTKLKDLRDGQIKSITDYQTANNANIFALQQADLRITERQVKDEARLDKIEPKVDYLDTMRNFGISNKEDFYTRHGYVAPGLPQASDEPTPTPPKQHK